MHVSLIRSLADRCFILLHSQALVKGASKDGSAVCFCLFVDIRSESGIRLLALELLIRPLWVLGREIGPSERAVSVLSQ